MRMRTTIVIAGLLVLQGCSGAPSQPDGAAQGGASEDAPEVCVKGALDASKGMLKTNDEIVAACQVYGEAISAEVGQSACEELGSKVASWRAIAKSPVTEQAYKMLTFNLNVSAARRALECDDGVVLFGELLARDEYKDTRDARALLLRATNQGADKIGDLDAMIAKQLKAKPADPFPGERGFVAPAAYRMFRDDYRKEVAVSCEALIEGMNAASAKMEGMVLGELLHVLWRGKCEQGVPFAERALTETIPSVRRVGCVLLGEVGAKRHIEKLEILGSSDGYSEIRGRQKIYPVRDACQEAAGKVKLRTM